MLACQRAAGPGAEPAGASATASPTHGHDDGELAKRAEPLALGSIYGVETTTIEARPGERFSLALPSEPQHSWQVDPELDQSVARVVDERTDGDTRYVIFDAVGIGPTDLRLRQRGPDSPAPGPPARELEIRVRVEPAE